MSDKTYGFETLSVHAGAAPDPTTGARAQPIYQTTAYVFEDADHAAALFNLQTVGFIYSRLTNPTNAALETRLATLEGGRGCTVTSSGHAAQVLGLFPLMSPGAEIVASSRLYGGSLQQMRNTYPKFGWKAEIVDADEPENFKRAVTANTKAFFIRAWPIPAASYQTSRPSRASPSRRRAPAGRQHAGHALALQADRLRRHPDRALDHQVPERQRHLDGRRGGQFRQFDWAKGGKFPSLAGPEPAYHGLNFFETFGDMAYTFHSHAVGLRDLGPSQAPFNAWLTMLGIETFGLRMDHERSEDVLVRLLQRIDRARRRRRRVVDLVGESRGKRPERDERLALARQRFHHPHRLEEALDQVDAEGEPGTGELAERRRRDCGASARARGRGWWRGSRRLRPTPGSRRPTRPGAPSRSSRSLRARTGGAARPAPRATPTSSRRGRPRGTGRRPR